MDTSHFGSVYTTCIDHDFHFHPLKKMYPVILKFKFYIFRDFIYLFGSQNYTLRGRENEREGFDAFIHSPHKGWDCGRPTPGLTSTTWAISLWLD